MIETKVPKDIRVYETKIIGPFSLRQAVCFLLLIFLDILIYSFMINPFSISADYAVYLLCLVDIPVAAFGFVKVMGVPLEKYLASVIKSSFLSPAGRKLERKVIHEKPRKKKKKKISGKDKKAHPEYRPYR